MDWEKVRNTSVYLRPGWRTVSNIRVTSLPTETEEKSSKNIKKIYHIGFRRKAKLLEETDIFKVRKCLSKILQIFPDAFLLTLCNGANTKLFWCLVTLKLSNRQRISSQDISQCPRRTVTVDITNQQPNTLVYYDTEILRCLNKQINLCDLTHGSFPMPIIKYRTPPIIFSNLKYDVYVKYEA